MEEQKSEQDKQAEGVKNSIKAIEGLFHAVNAASFPLQWYGPTMEGMQFLRQLHASLVSQLPKEDLEKIKAENTQAITPPTMQVVN